jgi:hypothetical protein
MAQVVEHMHSKHNALSLKREERKERGGGWRRGRSTNLQVEGDMINLLGNNIVEYHQELIAKDFLNKTRL